MTGLQRNFLSGLAACTLFCAPHAFAADASPAASPAAAASPAPAAAAAPPSKAALDAAMAILIDTGAGKSLDNVVPGMLAELEFRLGQTRPELKDSLRDAVHTVAPEFAKTEQQVLLHGVLSLAKRLNEKELTDVVKFYESDSGKKYIAAEPFVLGEIGADVQIWRHEMSTAMLVRVREEMKKKGIEVQ